MRYAPFLRAVLALLAPTALVLPLAAQTGPVVGLEQRFDELDQKVRVLERLLEIARDSVALAARSAARVTAGREGFSLASPDGDFLFRLRGYFQADGRAVVDAPVSAPVASVLQLRRIRPIAEVTAWRYFTVRVMPDFGGGRVTLFDAHLDVRPSPALGLRIGKTKPPVGLERLQSATDLRFVERGLPTNLAPNRDVGVQLFGEAGGGRWQYALGLFNGVPDLGNGDTDLTGDKDVAARLFLQPFLPRPGHPLRGLGLGLAVSRGVEHGTAAAPGLAAYVTPAQQPLFRYLDGAVADGERVRIAPQGWWHTGSFGVLGEYTVSRQEVARAATRASLTHHAWQLSGSWYATGERAAFTTVAPKRPFDLRAGGWGALEVVARVGALTIDADAFPRFADSTRAARAIHAVGVGLVWHLTRGEQFAVNYERSRFTGGAPGAAPRATEHALFFRLQQAF